MATTTGNDTFNVLRYGQTATWDALAGTDTVYFDRLTYSTSFFSITKDSSGFIHVDSTSAASHAYHLTLNNVERLSFSYGSNIIDLTTMFPANITYNGTAGNDVYAASTGDDVLNGLAGNDTLSGAGGNDTFNGGLGNDTLDGGTGTDTANFNVNKSTITDMHHTKSGGIVITSAEGTDTLTNIETIHFLDGNLTAGASGDIVRDFLATATIPTFTATTNGISAPVTPTLYTGPVTFLEYEYLGDALGNVLVAANGNDFINLLAGDDAANGGAGDDVLDGGTGSNFLTGGGGNDTLFLDGRSGAASWSTVTDYNAGDQVNIWGWVAGTSKLVLTDANGGAAGFTGITFHYDLDNNGLIDTSITFTGLTQAQIPAGQALSVVGNGYLLIG